MRGEVYRTTSELDADGLITSAYVRLDTGEALILPSSLADNHGVGDKVESIVRPSLHDTVMPTDAGESDTVGSA